MIKLIIKITCYQRTVVISNLLEVPTVLQLQRHSSKIGFNDISFINTHIFAGNEEYTMI